MIDGQDEQFQVQATVWLVEHDGFEGKFRGKKW
jgi:hypothetical protein